MIFEWLDYPYNDLVIGVMDFRGFEKKIIIDWNLNRQFNFPTYLLKHIRLIKKL